jgi:Kef-type K+ transport system membrane component KefB
MNPTNADVIHLLLAMMLLLLVAHSLGWLFVRFRQPRVAGEILGGLLLGPTVLGLWLPDWQRFVFQDGKATQIGLGIFYQLGLLLLMYCSGAELRSILTRRDGKATIGIALLGNLLPFVPGSPSSGSTTPTASSALPATVPPSCWCSLSPWRSPASR